LLILATRQLLLKSLFQLEAKHETEPSLGKWQTALGERQVLMDSIQPFHLSKKHKRRSITDETESCQKLPILSFLNQQKGGNKNTSPSAIISSEVARR